MIRVELPSVLLDTCALIFLASGDRMHPAALAAIEAAARSSGVLVSPISAWEIGLLSRPKRGPPIDFRPDPKTWFARAVSQQGLRLAPLTPEMAIDSSHLPGALHGDPADRLLMATARHLSVPIVTRDRLIQDYAATGAVQVIAC